MKQRKSNQKFRLIFSVIIALVFFLSPFYLLISTSVTGAIVQYTYCNNNTYNTFDTICPFNNPVTTANQALCLSGGITGVTYGVGPTIGYVDSMNSVNFDGVVYAGADTQNNISFPITFTLSQTWSSIHSSSGTNVNIHGAYNGDGLITNDYCVELENNVTYDSINRSANSGSNNLPTVSTIPIDGLSFVILTWKGPANLTGSPSWLKLLVNNTGTYSGNGYTNLFSGQLIYEQDGNVTPSTSNFPFILDVNRYWTEQVVQYTIPTVYVTVTNTNEILNTPNVTDTNWMVMLMFNFILGFAFLGAGPFIGGKSPFLFAMLFFSGMTVGGVLGNFSIGLNAGHIVTWADPLIFGLIDAVCLISRGL